MPANGWIACLKNSMNYFANVIANIAQAIQETESYTLASVTKHEEKVVLTWLEFRHMTSICLLF